MVSDVIIFRNFITGQREKVFIQRLDYYIGNAETNCYLTIDSLQSFINFFTPFVDHEKCKKEKESLEGLQEQISSKQENLQELLAACKTTNSVHLSPTLISKALTKLLGSVKKLPKCPMNDIMDQFDEIYKQFVELNDVIDQHVSTAIRELQRAYSSIVDTQKLQDELQQLCYNTETEAQRIREYITEFYELLQSKLKEKTPTAVAMESSDKNYNDELSSTEYQASDNAPPLSTSKNNPESTLVAAEHDVNLMSYDFVSMSPNRQGDQQSPKTFTQTSSTSYVLIDSDKFSVGDLVLLLPTPHEGQLFVAHTKSYFIFLDKSCLSQFDLSPNKQANNPIAGEVVALPEQHHVNRDSTEAEHDYKINPNVKSYYTIKCRKPVDVTIKGRPSPKSTRKRKN